MTADALRDRIAAAWSDHETGTLHPEGYVPCACGQRFSSPQALARHRASVILEVLADANPTDLGLETSGVWYCRRHSGIANEDDRRTLCPWWDHADHCDAEHDEGLDDGACSPCQWVELLIPPARKEDDHG